MADFDDFEKALVGELREAASASYAEHAAPHAQGSKPDGSPSILASDLAPVMEAVVADAVALAIRRYHEWTESAPL